jgi:hypothetical protein
MKLIAVSAIFLTLVLATIANAQPITTTKGAKSDEINLKIQKLELLTKILPILMTKQQYKDMLLAIAKARQKMRVQKEGEDDTLAKLDGTISDALDAALTKGTYPSHDVENAIVNANKDASIKEAVLGAEVTEQIYAVVSQSFNSGQIKVMAGSFADSYIDSTKKKGDLKDDFKVKFFIQAVFLDPYAFDIISKLEDMTPADTGKKDGG